MKPLSPAEPPRAELFGRAEEVADDEEEDEEEERGSPESPGPAAEVRSMAEKKHTILLEQEPRNPRS